MARIVSFVVLVAILLVIAGLFYQVIARFLLPMFLAVLLVVIFGPLHRWLVVKCRGRVRLAAGLTTAAILLILLIPFLLILIPATIEGFAVYDSVVSNGDMAQAGGEEVEEAGENNRTGIRALQSMLAHKMVERFEKFGDSTTVAEMEEIIAEKVKEWLTPLLFAAPGYLGHTLLGVVVMVLSLYYFLADGPAMVRTLMRLSPLDDKYEEQLIVQFDNLTRAVVVATLLSAFVQGILAGIGFAVVGLSSVFLLTVLTMLFAMVPFVGAAAIWIPASAWLLYQGQTAAGIGLAIYGAAIVSTADNFIKPWILHGRSNLHPLLALLSVLGGVQALGPIGIFVGPMVVAFLQTLLNMLHKELDAMGKSLAEKGR